MYFLLSQNILPVVFAVLAVLISWYLWRRKVIGLSSNSGEKTHIVTAGKKDEDDEVTVEEATKFLQGAGIIKARDIHYLSEDEKEKISRESSEPLSENQEKKKVKEMTMADASNIQTYYKSSRLGIKDIENQMTEEELDQEKEMRRKQLEEIFKLLETDRDKYGVTTMDDLQAQMKLYSR
ncbi:matrix-remodeling-associated protein 7-like [Stylophora pistillata]|uniref:matrix-remodeling-associated protein 7-like n=1 Tax=Stylophora pistillata TaxID=50429 RepID=UPI000C048887|nr:matrix-remodeling-associated protein 7-like [Stylophora pistillata]